MAEGDMLIVFGLDGDPELPVVAVTTPGADVAEHVKHLVGVGNAFYVFTSLPFNYSNGIVVTWAGAPLVSESVEENQQAIITMLESPPLNKVSAA